MKRTALFLVLVAGFALTPFALAAGPEQELLEAWKLLDIERDPAAAAGVFRAVWEDKEAPRSARAEGLAGLVRCEKMRGRPTGELLSILTSDYGDVPRVARMISGLLPASAEPTTFATGTRLLRTREFLDLDTGGTFAEPATLSGDRAEVALADGAIELLVRGSTDPDMAGLVDWQSDAAWTRVVTHEGRTAWIQVLREGGLPVVRFVTRLTGSAEPLPEPRNLCCLGTQGGIELRFDADPRYARYRIEKRLSILSPYEAVAVTEAPGYLDPAGADDRVRYRVTGVTSDGHQGLPGLAEGTRASRGIRYGSVVFRWEPDSPRGLDFLRGELREGARDLVFLGTAGGRSVATFADFTGASVGLPAEDDPSPWARRSRGSVPPNLDFLVPLSGGGVARCRWVPVENRGVKLLYELNPDAATFPRILELTARKVAEGVEVLVTTAEGVQVGSVQATDVMGGGSPRSIPIRDGRALDRSASTGTIVTYEAVGQDALGRLTPIARTTLNLLPAEPRAGTFSFHFHQGYSLERGEICPAEEADVVFSSAAGGISSVELTAPGGIVNLGGLKRLGRRFRSREAILDALVRAEPDQLRFREEARGDSRTAWEDVFLLRTKHGGWAKLAIVRRAGSGSWTEMPVTVKYVLNFRAPVFGEAETAFSKAGFVLDAEKLVAADRGFELEFEHPELADRVQEDLVDLDERARALSARLGGNVTGLLSRHHARPLGRDDAYLRSTLSVEHATRDDRQLTKNEWDLLYGNGPGSDEITVGVLGGQGAIWDLGKASFEAVPRPDGEYTAVETAPAQVGHLYVVHTVDRDSDLWSKFHVIEAEPAKWVILRWERIEDPTPYLGLERSPDAVMRAPRARIQIRGGAAGGNPNRAFLDGSVSRVDEVRRAKLDLSGTIDIGEKHRAFIDGGLVPEGRVFLINSIEFTARAEGDSNGHGEFVFGIGRFRVAQLNEISRRTDEFMLETADGEETAVKGVDYPVKRLIHCRIPVRSGDEKQVYAEIANSSWCDVVLEGEFIDEGAVPPTVGGPQPVAWFVSKLSHPDPAVVEAAFGKLEEIGEAARPYLTQMLAMPYYAPLRARIEKAIAKIK